MGWFGLVAVVGVVFEGGMAMVAARAARRAGRRAAVDGSVWVRVGLALAFGIVAARSLLGLDGAASTVLTFVVGATILGTLVLFGVSMVRAIRAARTRKLHPGGEPMAKLSRPSWDVRDLRRVFLGFPIAMVLFLVVILFIAPWQGDDPVPWWAVAALVAYGSVSITILQWFRRLPLSTGSARELASGYTGAMFVGVGISETPALLAFASVFILGSAWLYVIGLTFALIGLALVAPTDRDIDRRQERLSAAGVSLSLHEALTVRPAGSR